MVSQCTLGQPVAFQWHSSIHWTSQCTLGQGKENPGTNVDTCHDLSPDDNDIVSSDIYNLSPEVFDFRRRYFSNFVFAHVNINSFRHKYPFIRDMLNKLPADLLAISESKLDHSSTDPQFQVTDYATTSSDNLAGIWVNATTYEYFFFWREKQILNSHVSSRWHRAIQ